MCPLGAWVNKHMRLMERALMMRDLTWAVTPYLCCQDDNLEALSGA